MASLDDLKELDDFKLFKDFIKRFILQSEDLWKLIFYGSGNPLLLDVSENPYEIFTPSSEHGCVLFRRKNDTILNEEQVSVLIDFESASSSCEYDSVYIVVRIIAKGSNIQDLENGVNRSFAISKLFDDEFNTANINGLGEVKKKSMTPLSVNEENAGYLLLYTGHSFSSDIINNKNFKKRLLEGR